MYGKFILSVIVGFVFAYRITGWYTQTLSDFENKNNTLNSALVARNEKLRKLRSGIKLVCKSHKIEYSETENGEIHIESKFGNGVKIIL